ncbi:MAG: hypothetical protein GY796_23405 [Chloroflexi bacterium]|nr:hypothetical protein [Chloroflexota bacterium]
MTQLFFVWLGSKRAQKNHVPEKGWRLDRAMQAGLPVPNGGIFLDDFYWLARQEEIVLADNGRLSISQPQKLYDLLYTAVRFPHLDKPCAIRPLFGRTLAISPQLNIDMNDSAVLAAALVDLWTAVLPHEETTGHELLVQEMVAAEVIGTAVSHVQTATDTITTPTDSLTLPHLGRWQKPAAAAPDHIQRLQKLLRGVRRTFGNGDWEVTWGDDGRVCWLLQIQAIL